MAQMLRSKTLRRIISALEELVSKPAHNKHPLSGFTLFELNQIGKFIAEFDGNTTDIAPQEQSTKVFWELKILSSANPVSGKRQLMTLSCTSLEDARLTFDRYSKKAWSVHSLKQITTTTSVHTDLVSDQLKIAS